MRVVSGAGWESVVSKVKSTNPAYAAGVVGPDGRVRCNSKPHTRVCDGERRCDLGRMGACTVEVGEKCPPRRACDGVGACVWGRHGQCPPTIAIGDPCPCGQLPVTGRERCHVHGGSTPRGLALPQTKHGLLSKDLPTRMASVSKEIEAAQAGQISLLEKMRALDAVWYGLAHEVENNPNDGPDAWVKLAEALKRMGAHGPVMTDDGGAEHSAEYMEAYKDARRIVAGRMKTYAALKAFLDVTERSRKLFDSQRRRDDALRLNMPIHRVLLMLTTLQDAVNEMLAELPITAEERNRARRRIADRVDLVLHGRGSGT